MTFKKRDIARGPVRLRVSGLAVLLILIATAVPAGLRNPRSFRWQFMVQPGDALGNIFLYVPLGLFLQSTMRLPAVLVYATGISALIEIAQIFFIRRFPSPVDVLCNVSGALCGVVLGRVFKLRSDRVDLGFALGSYAMAAAAVLAVAYLSMPGNPPSFVDRGVLCVLAVLCAAGLLGVFQPRNVYVMFGCGAIGGGVAGVLLMSVVRMSAFQVLAIGAILGMSLAGCCIGGASGMVANLRSSRSIDSSEARSNLWSDT